MSPGDEVGRIWKFEILMPAEDPPQFSAADHQKPYSCGIRSDSMALGQSGPWQSPAVRALPSPCRYDVLPKRQLRSSGSRASALVQPVSNHASL